MENIINAKLDSVIVKFQTKIRKNLQLFCFSSDGILYFSKFKKKEFSNYEFNNFIGKFSKVSFKKDSSIKKIKYSNIVEYGNSLIKNELSNLLFVLNMSDFEAWLGEMFNIIFSSRHDIFLRRLDLEKFPLKASLIENTDNINDVWNRIIEQYVSDKFYKGMSIVLEDFLIACEIKKTKDFDENIGKLNEHSLCRNLIIHNKNKVNKIYLDKAGKFNKFSKIGDKVEISEKCLFEQGDNLLFFMQEIRKKIKNN